MCPRVGSGILAKFLLRILPTFLPGFLKKFLYGFLSGFFHRFYTRLLQGFFLYPSWVFSRNFFIDFSWSSFMDFFCIEDSSWILPGFSSGIPIGIISRPLRGIPPRVHQYFKLRHKFYGGSFRYFSLDLLRVFLRNSFRHSFIDI